jgi:hypothetical protein
VIDECVWAIRAPVATVPTATHDVEVGQLTPNNTLAPRWVAGRSVVDHCPVFDSTSMRRSVEFTPLLTEPTPTQVAATQLKPST